MQSRCGWDTITKEKPGGTIASKLCDTKTSPRRSDSLKMPVAPRPLDVPSPRSMQSRTKKSSRRIEVCGTRGMLSLKGLGQDPTGPMCCTGCVRGRYGPTKSMQCAGGKRRQTEQKIVKRALTKANQFRTGFSELAWFKDLPSRLVFVHPLLNPAWSNLQTSTLRNVTLHNPTPSFVSIVTP